MKIIERTHCEISRNADLEQLYSFPKFPVFMGCLNQPEADDLMQVMSWSISRGSGLIQLDKLIPLDVLYPESHGAGVVGELWKKHHSAFAKFLSRFLPTSVLEIGGSHGILANKYQEFDDIPWIILEPNPSPVDGCKARFIRGFFDDKFTHTDVFDTVVHSHVFEHIYTPDQFMCHLSGFMVPSQHLVFSLPNLEVMLERKYNNCINFEHTIFLTEPYVEFLIAKHGFRLAAKEYFMDDHSIFYAAVRDPSVKPITLPLGLYEKNKRLYLNYVKYHEELIKELNRKISQSTQPIYLFGAHVFAQYLIAFGLDTCRIVGILDNDKNKQGKRLYGTDLMVESPSIIKNIERAMVILKAGVYNKEIKSQILGEINKNVEFLD